MMHRVQCALLAAVAAIGLASAASADDMPDQARPVVAPVANWTGCYIGANAGYGWARKDWVDAGAPVGSNTSAGGLFGGQIGCDYQFASNWVVGGQGMYGMNVHRAVLATGEVESGATVHLVEGGYDTGPVVAQRRVGVHPGDTPETLAERVQDCERRLVVGFLSDIARGKITLPYAP